MAWQAFTATGYRDLLTKIAALATSRHIESLAVNAGGTGYTVGDILTITHAGAFLSATLEVLTVGGGGAILTVALRNWGAFGNRATTATVSAGGSGYAVNDIIQVEGGTQTEKGKFRVTTVSAGAVTAVTLFETGGDYTATPSNPAATTKVGPAAGSGSGATLTVTYTGLIGTSGISASGGTGTGATFNFSLVASGWSSQRNRNNFSFNGSTDEKEVVLKGTVSGGDPPFSLFRTYTATVGVDTFFGIAFAMSTAYNDSLTMENQPGLFKTITPAATGGSYTQVFNVSHSAWLSFTGRRLVGVAKAVGGAITSYNPFYTGLLNPFGTAVENPYPAFVSGSSAIHENAPDAGGSGQTGLTELNRQNSTVGSPACFRRPGDAATVDVFNSTGFTFSTTPDGNNCMFPLGENRNFTGSAAEVVSDNGKFTFFDGIGLHTGGSATRLLFPSINSGGDLFLLVPATVVSTPNATVGGQTFDVDVMGELEGVSWVSATKTDGSSFGVEDTLTQGSLRHRIFRNAHRTERYSFFAIAEQ